MPIIDIWINCPDDAVANALSEALINERLAACTNIMGAVQSAYRWNGKIEHETETALLVKTRTELFDAVSRRVTELHPYDVPSIIGLPVAMVNDAYREWVIAETA